VDNPRLQYRRLRITLDQERDALSSACPCVRRALPVSCRCPVRDRYRHRRRPSGHPVVDFDLAAEELAALDSLDTGVRGGPEPEDVTREAFGREIPEA
jgi:hypothetical protein